MAVIDDIPDELLHKIISLALKNKSLEFDLRPLFIWPQDPTARFCTLVCKKWSYTATPLLYSTIYLKSECQALKLYDALCLEHKPGNLIRNLVLGEYDIGDFLQSIFHSMGRLDTLVLWLTGRDEACHVDGIIRALPCINPRRVMLQDCSRDWHGIRHVFSKTEQSLVNRVNMCIQEHWTQLVCYCKKKLNALR
jgi:F-box-like